MSPESNPSPEPSPCRFCGSVVELRWGRPEFEITDGAVRGLVTQATTYCDGCGRRKSQQILAAGDESGPEPACGGHPGAEAHAHCPRCGEAVWAGTAHHCPAGFDA